MNIIWLIGAIAFGLSLGGYTLYLIRDFNIKNINKTQIDYSQTLCALTIISLFACGWFIVIPLYFIDKLIKYIIYVNEKPKTLKERLIKEIREI